MTFYIFSKKLFSLPPVIKKDAKGSLKTFSSKNKYVKKILKYIVILERKVIKMKK